MVSESWIRSKVIFDDSNEISVEDLRRNIWNNDKIPVRPTLLARLDTMIGPVVYWKEFRFISLYYFNRFLQKNCLIYEIYRENTLRPTFWATMLPTPLMICGPIFVYYFNKVYFTQINAIFSNLFVFSVAESRKTEKRRKFWSEDHWSAVPGTCPIQTIGPNR